MDKKEHELINRLDDFIHSALYKNIINTTRFLNPYEQSLAVQKLRTINGVLYKIDGGYQSSERNIIAVYPDNEYTEPEKYLALVKVQFTKYDTRYLNHRMILGSVLSLGIKRDGIGDIIIDKDAAYIIATKQMAKYIDDHLLKVAHAHVSTTYVDDTTSIKLDLKEPAIVSGTIASLRIDCIIALALKISRTKANDLITKQLVYVNWQLVTKPTMIVEEGQTITVRKKGRILLTHIGDISRKNRVWVELEVLG